MKKPASLRAAIETALPHLIANPDQLVMFVDSGRTACGLGSDHFEYAYTVTIVLLDFAQSIDALVIPIHRWLKLNQPSLLQNPETSREAIKFEAEFLSHNSVDLRLEIKLTERVCVTTNSGTTTIAYPPEPQL